MCAIYGLAGPSANLEIRKSQLENMGQKMTHRGPDGEGSVDGEGFLFGHRRLAIIDRDLGAQPMVSEDKSISLTFNGEIYNYLELRQTLSREGVRFVTNSDTEVLLRCYQHFGRGMLSKLNGMFSFAIFDARSRSLFIARDHFGIKPLYYTQLRDGTVVFSSEIKALFCIPEIKPQLDPKGLNEYLTFQFCLRDRTLFKNIKKLPPACAMEYSVADHKVVIKRWWQPSYDINQTDSADFFKDKLKYLVHDSVKGQLRSDVPIGAHLSGGLDSSIVVTSAAGQYGEQLACFTGKFLEGEKYDESSFARIVSQANSCAHHEITVSSQDLSEHLSFLSYVMDEPAAGPGLLPQYIVSKYAKRHVSVVLGGQGGDELFGGYTRYLVAYLEQCLKGEIFGTKEESGHVVTLSSIIPNLPSLKNYSPMISRFWNSGVFDSMDSRYFKLLDRGEQLREVVTREFLSELDHDDLFEDFKAIFTESNSSSYLNKMTYFDQQTLLPALLHVEDRVSMSVSLESRVPLLDYRIAELAATIPPSIKYLGGQSKRVLSEAFASILPDPIIKRTDKMGFPVPLNDWLKGPLKEFMSDTLGSRSFRERGLFDLSKSREIFKHQENFGRELWGLLSLELWFKNHIDA